MAKIFIVSLLSLFLISCSTYTSSCHPPAELMKEATALSENDVKSTSQVDNEIAWNKDITQYNIVATEKNQLIKWVKERC